MKKNLLYFVLTPLIISAIVAILLNFYLDRYFVSKAKEEMQNILLSNRGFHEYIQKVLHPVFFQAMEHGYIAKNFYEPQALSSTYIVRSIHELYNEERAKQGLKPVYYKLAANNPRNPVNRADAWESDKIRLFNETPSIKEQEEIVTNDGKKYLYYAVPFLKNEQRCMRCHGDPKDAPIGLRKIYSDNGGFYEKIGEIRAIETMRMPISQEGYVATMIAGSAGSGIFAIVALFLFNAGLRTRVKEKTKDLELEITERVKAEEQARKNEENFRTLFNKSADAIFLVRPDGSIADVNDMVCKRYKYSREELLKMNVSQIDSPATSKFAPGRTARVVKDGLFVFEAEHITKDGEAFPVEANASSIVLNGETILISTCRDITERKRAQEALRDEKERLAVTLRSIGDGVIVADIKGAVVLLNKVAEQLTGWSSEEAKGKPLTQVFNITNESTREKIVNPAEDGLRTGMPVSLPNQGVLIKRDGTEITITNSAAPIKDKHSETIGIVLVFRDITAQHRMEQEMQKLEKLESLGLLAGGLAHDFNNLLTSIIGNLSLVKVQLGADNKSFTRLTNAEKAAQRATDLTHQLLTFAKGGAPIKKSVSIAEIARETCQFAMSGSNSQCQYTIPPSLWSVEVDRGQMSQVFNNLALNSIHAMPTGGMIHVGFENVTLQNNEITSLREGDYVKITFKDEGIGIPESKLTRIFEPYYTTRSGGSGLGLAMVLSIINRHDGHITVESRLNAGTTFTMYIPAVRDTIFPETLRTTGANAGHGKVLVMDDEAMIRDVAGEILRELGYEVEFAKDGKEAIDAYLKAKQEERPFDVVIMDLTVPGGMGGKEAIRYLRAVAPDAKVIVSSGYSMDPIMAEYEKYGFCGVVCKPYNANDISEVITTVRSQKMND